MECSELLCRRVLVMDDDNLILEVVASLLECLGYEAATCTNGEDAIELYRLRMDQQMPFLTAILDLQVVNGMGGIEAAKAILEVNPIAKLVVSSAYSDHCPQCKDLFTYSLPKPYTVEELETVLASLNAPPSADY